MKVVMKLKAYMERHRLKLREMSEFTGIAISQLSRFAREERLPGWDDVRAIALATDLAVMPNDWIDLPSRAELKARKATA